MTEWRKVKLGDILDFYNGKAIKSSSGIIPIYGANGIIGRTNRSLYNNAIIIGRVGAYCGSVALCEKDFWASDNTIVTKPKDDNNTLFFYYLLDTMDLNKYAGGSAQPLLTQSTLKSLETYIPCANVQQRIAEVLSRYDALIENYQRQIKLLEEAAQRLYKEWFVDLRFPGHQSTPIINNLPQSWQKKKITDILDIKYGKDHKKLKDGPIPVYGTGGIMRYADSCLYCGESVLIPRKGSLNNIMLVNGSFWTIDTMFYSIPKIENAAKIAYFYLKDLDMYSFNIGAAVPSMTINILSGMEISLPTDEIRSEFECTVDNYYQQIALLENQIRNLSEARDRLLPKLMSAEIDV